MRNLNLARNYLGEFAVGVLERRKTTIMLALLFVRVCQKKKHLMERMMAVIAMTREMATLG
ncbi:MAG: hypothetical protein ACR2PA_14100, partial [Hyphomicrobiaceae bacterium]